MSDVWLCATPRKEKEWEENLASQRAQAAKQAELAARDLMRLSRPGSKGATGTPATHEGSGFAWSFLSHLSAMVLNRLQMTISNVHVCFQVTSSLHPPPQVSGKPALLKRVLCYAHPQCQRSFWPVALLIIHASTAQVLSTPTFCLMGSQTPESPCAGDCTAWYGVSESWS